ncbi:hypothetical protein [uncultured Tenacibaculum sp.]|uniref:hypothetical protein n=1 Tax=uncultured Tenacibaculum sp. TaxID=174713 RepID=UPI00260DD7AB|nr:hypothetical protein [uncultured Tenacibaculum sp.]
MKRETEKNISEFLIVILAYLISLILSGVFRINSILNTLNNEIVESAKLSSYVGLITSSIFSSIVIIIIALIAYFTIKTFKLKIETNLLIDGITTSIYILIIFELIRVILTLLIFDEAVASIAFHDNIIVGLKNSKWFFYDSIIKYLMILSTGIVFILNTIPKNKNYSSVILLSAIISICFYISTINLSITI